MKPTYEQLEAKIEKLEDLLKQALERIIILEQRLNKNSSNSSKPPSTDQKGSTPPAPKKPRVSRSGFTRPLFPADRVDQHIECTLERCPHCQSEDLKLLSRPVIQQQAELPEVKAIVTEYSCRRYRCQRCSKKVMGSLPDGVPKSAFGPKLMALVTTFTGVFHLAQRETIQLLKHLYDVDVSEGSIVNIQEKVSDALKDPYEKIHRCVIDSSYAKHFDETPWRQNGKRQYAWVASTYQASFFAIEPSRNQEAFRKIIGENLSIPAVTDRYGAYNILTGPHQYCLAHLIRNFHAFAEQKGAIGVLGTTIEEHLRTACRLQANFRDKELTKRQFTGRLRALKQRLEDCLLDGYLSACDGLSSLCDRVLRDFQHLWTFQTVEGMDSTNNLAERDLRRLVLWRKKSYGTRSDRGKRFVERITSVVETLKKQHQNIFEFLVQAVSVSFRAQPPPLVIHGLTT